MEIKIEGENLCRLCAAALECTLEENNLFHLDNLFIHQQIKEIAGFMVENEPELPRHFCENCKIQLKQASDLRKSLIEVHKFFKKSYKKSLLKSEAAEAVHSTFDAIFIPSKIEEDTIDANSIADDFCELENNALSDSDAFDDCHTDEEELKPKTMIIKDCHTEEEELKPKTMMIEDCHSEEEKLKPKTKTKTKKSKSKNFLKYKTKKKKEKTDSDETAVDSFICEQCGMSFKTMKFLEVHAVRHEERKFQCDICSAKFFLPTELKRHQVSHTGEKPASCRFCDTKFLNKSNRNRHEKSQHLKLRPFPCELCGKAFGNTHLRKSHMVVHTKERSFYCELCKKSFLRKTHLTTHYRSTAHKKNEMEAGSLENQYL